jgi:CRISPR type III-A-associated RAMP protein Csm4
MKFPIIKFSFTAPLHISNRRADYGITEKIIHSDTIHAAVLSALSVLGKTSAQINEIKDKFIFSSLFPFTSIRNEGKPVYFLAKPFGVLPEQNENDEKRPTAKEFKQIQYWDIQFFHHFLNQTLVQSLSGAVKGDYLTFNDIEPTFVLNDVLPRVRIPREANEKNTEPYYIDRLFFKSGSGLYSFFYSENDEIREAVFSALRLLEEEGLGTDKHVGNGQFNFSTDELELNCPSTANYGVALGLFCPVNNIQLTQMVDDKCGFDMIKRGGWISSPPYLSYRKKSVYMFKPGSIFKTKDLSKLNNGLFLGGNVLDLKPDISLEHSIWRSGKTLFLPLNY